jgi:hypothetical protein
VTSSRETDWSKRFHDWNIIKFKQMSANLLSRYSFHQGEKSLFIWRDKFPLPIKRYSKKIHFVFMIKRRVFLLIIMQINSMLSFVTDNCEYICNVILLPINSLLILKTSNYLLASFFKILCVETWCMKDIILSYIAVHIERKTY